MNAEVWWSYLLVPVGLVCGGGQCVAVRVLQASRERRAHLREGGGAVGGHVQDRLPGAPEILRPLHDQRVRPRALQTRGPVRKQHFHIK